MRKYTRTCIATAATAIAVVLLLCINVVAETTTGNVEAAVLAKEVRGMGWVVFAARSEHGDWDLYLCRPDGSDRRNITRTAEYSEVAPRFSRDGKRLLFRRLSRQETIDGNDYGAQGTLVSANSDGTDPKVIGGQGEYSWASWSPDGQQVVCLSLQGISFVDLNTRRVTRTISRKGFFQQITWSPDGKRLSGVANSYGTGWTVAQMEVATGKAAAVSRFQCCTPDWFPDSGHLIFSSRPADQKSNDGKGWRQLWMADVQGRSRRLVYGEDGRHVYGGCVSPNNRYVLFTGNMLEDGDPQNAGAPMGLVRLEDTPIVGGPSPELSKLFPDANHGPVLQLPQGWEPDWTHADLSLGSGAAPKQRTQENEGFQQ